MDERQLKFVYSVIERKGVRNAAETLGVDPSAVSRTISGIERSLGMTLFQRHGRSMEPTEAAMVLHGYYRENLLHHAQLEAKLDDLRGLRSGSISMGISEGFVEELFDGPIGHFRQSYPGIRISLIHGSVDEITRRVAESTLDLGLTHNAAPQDGAQVVARRSMPIDLIVPHDHPLAIRNTSVSVEELVEIPLALVESGYGLRRAVEVFEFTHRVQLRPIFTTNGLAGLKAFVMRGHGATLLSQTTMRREIAAGGVRALTIDEPIFRQTEAQLLARKRRRLPPAAAEMARLIAAFLSME